MATHSAGVFGYLSRNDVVVTARPTFMAMRVITVLAVTTGLFLAACGSSGGSATESASATGEVAGLFGTKGVEIRVNNAGSVPMYVWTRRSASETKLDPGQATNFYGNTKIGNDVELAMSNVPRGQANQTVEIDGKNLTVGEPSVTIGGLTTYMTVGQSTDTGGQAAGAFWKAVVKREGDRADYKFFNIDVRWN